MIRMPDPQWPHLTLRSTPLNHLAFEMFLCVVSVLENRQLIPTKDHPTENGWKEVVWSLTSADLDVDATKNFFRPAAYALVDAMTSIDMQDLPYAILPDFVESDPRASLQMAVVTDPETGVSLRLRRWYSIVKQQEFMAVDICSEGYTRSVETADAFLTA